MQRSRRKHLAVAGMSLAIFAMAIVGTANLRATAVGGGASWWQINVLWPLMNSFSGGAPSAQPLETGSQSTSDSEVWDYGSTYDAYYSAGEIEDCNEEGAECSLNGPTTQACFAEDGEEVQEICCVIYNNRGNYSTEWVQGTECPRDSLEDALEPIDCGSFVSCEEEEASATQDCVNSDTQEDSIVVCCELLNNYGGSFNPKSFEYVEGECPKPELEKCDEQEKSCEEAEAHGQCDNGYDGLFTKIQTCCNIRNHDTGELSLEWIDKPFCPQECTSETASGSECTVAGETVPCYDGSAYAGFEMTCCRIDDNGTENNVWVEGESCPILETPFCDYGSGDCTMGETSECNETDDNGRLSPAHRVCCPSEESGDGAYVWVNGFYCDVPAKRGPSDPVFNSSFERNAAAMQPIQSPGSWFSNFLRGLFGN